VSAQRVIETRALSKHFRHPLFSWQVKARALTELDLEVEAGEIYGLLGPNGSGKTTTLKLLLGLLHPSSGELAVFGRSPRDPGIKHRLGYLPEETPLYPYLSATETLDFYGRLFDLDRRERARRGAALLELVGLSHAAERPVGDFSKGMRRRIGLAQCLLGDPELVILDEPTSGLDPLGCREIKDLIEALRDKSKTVLLCSHLLSDVEDLCDRVSILYGGRTAARGRVSELCAGADALCLTLPADDPRRAAIEEVLATAPGPPLSFAPRRDRLEAVFLDTIATAHLERRVTDGAGRAGASADLGFLSTGAPEVEVEGLAASEVEPGAATKGAALPRPERVDARLLATLSGPAARGPAEAAAVTTPGPAANAPLLERLGTREAVVGPGEGSARGAPTAGSEQSAAQPETARGAPDDPDDALLDRLSRGPGASS
jgi:ABC-2 type transport system ATP-binding protein